MWHNLESVKKSGVARDSVHEVCDRGRDVATANLIENWIDEADSRAWFLVEVGKAL
jgi:DNA-binding ferritin-like protein